MIKGIMFCNRWVKCKFKLIKIYKTFKYKILGRKILLFIVIYVFFLVIQMRQEKEDSRKRV